MRNPTYTFSSSSVVVVSQEQVSSSVHGEVVIFNLKSGSYYGLNPVGAFIWSLMQEPKTVDTIFTSLLQEYEVDPEVCDRELRLLLTDLATAGLIEVKNQAAV
jgi:hypothetical protein